MNTGDTVKFTGDVTDSQVNCGTSLHCLDMKTEYNFCCLDCLKEYKF